MWCWLMAFDILDYAQRFGPVFIEGEDGTWSNPKHFTE